MKTLFCLPWSQLYPDIFFSILLSFAGALRGALLQRAHGEAEKDASREAAAQRRARVRDSLRKPAVPVKSVLASSDSKSQTKPRRKEAYRGERTGLLSSWRRILKQSNKHSKANGVMNGHGTTAKHNRANGTPRRLRENPNGLLFPEASENLPHPGFPLGGMRKGESPTVDLSQSQGRQTNL